MRRFTAFEDAALTGRLERLDRARAICSKGLQNGSRSWRPRADGSAATRCSSSFPPP